MVGLRHQLHLVWLLLFSQGSHGRMAEHPRETVGASLIQDATSHQPEVLVS